MLAGSMLWLVIGGAGLLGALCFAASVAGGRGDVMPVLEGGDPMSPGFGKEDKTFGDARMADFTLQEDAPLMADLFGDPGKGMFLGWAMGSFDRDWVYHQQRQMFYEGERHGLTCAPTRSGKGTCTIIPNLALLRRSVIVIDPKGQNAAVTAAHRATFSDTYLLNPFNEHGLGTARYNPLAHLSIDDPNVFADVASLSEALILSEGKDPHWPDSARNLVAVLILNLLATRGSEASLPQIREYLGLPDAALVKEVEAMVRSRYRFISELAGQFLGGTDEIKNIVSTARTQTKFLSDPLFADPDTGLLTGDDFRISDFKRKVSSLYIILPFKHLAAYSRFLRLITVSALEQLMSVPGGIQTTMMLDEFKMLGRLSAVENAFSMAAGYNVQLWPFIQNLGQLREVYGDAWMDILSGCGVIQWFAPNDDLTAEFMSKRIGDYTQFIVNRSTSDSTGQNDNRGSSSGFGLNSGSHSHGSGNSWGTSVNYAYSKVGLPLMPPRNVMALPSDKSIVMLNGLKHHVLAFRRPYWTINAIKGVVAPDPFHPGAGEA